MSIYIIFISMKRAGSQQNLASCRTASQCQQREFTFYKQLLPDMSRSAAQFKGLLVATLRLFPAPRRSGRQLVAQRITAATRPCGTVFVVIAWRGSLS